jgi:hypothetical protein
VAATGRIALATAEQLAAPHPRLAALLAPRDAVWEHDGIGLTSPGWRAAHHKVFDQLGARLPERADGALEVGLGQALRYRLRLTLEGAASVPAEHGDGRVVHPEALPDTDLVTVADTDLLETFLLLRDHHAPTEFVWRVEVPRGLASTRREPNGSLLFLDRQGDAVLRVKPPFAVDAQGTRREATLAWDGQRLAVRLDPTGLAWPVLLDPVIELAAWVQVATTGPPGGKYRGMVYDAVRGQTLVCGSAGRLWAWNGSAWSQLAQAWGPCSSQGAELAYDSARQVTVSWQNAAHTWEWNGSSWADRSVAGPSVRSDFAMAYDVTRGVVVLYGGHLNYLTFYSDTWEWNGTTWSQRATGGTNPWARIDTAAAYFPPVGQVVLQGGRRDDTYDSGVATALAWNGTTWTPLTYGGYASNDRFGHGLVHDATLGGLIAYGNQTDGESASTTALTRGYYPWCTDWCWEELVSGYGSTNPGRRQGVAMAYDSTRRRVVMFGGLDLDTTTYRTDTWELHSRGTSCTSASQCGTPYCVDGVCCEQSACPGSCRACNTPDYPGECAAVTGTTDPDTCTGAQRCNATGVCLATEGQPCSGSAQCASGLCTDSTCCGASCGSCRSCGVAGHLGECWPVTNQEDPDSCHTTHSCDAAGACKAYQGQACSGGDQCLSGNCVDGVCCASAACGTCQRCSDPASLGTCAVVKGAADPDSCAGSCDAAGACKRLRGQACSVTGDCLSDPCVDGVCCEHTCATCQACNLSGSPGTCAAVINAEDPDTCATTSTCNGGGVCKKKQGQPCLPGECLSGFCVDNVCCESACNTVCQACAAALKAAGPDGTCGAVHAGLDPHGTCSDEGAATCGFDGTCDGTGSCRRYMYGSACGVTTCVGNTQSGFACNGLGTCVAAVTYDCGYFRCVGTACRMSCADGSDCVTAAWCDAGACEPKRILGAPCPRNDACQSGFCVEGVCCDSTCTGLCQACAAANKTAGPDGTCGFAKAGADPHGTCPDDGAPTCDRNGTCDGQGQCALYPAGTTCRPALCQDALLATYQCDGHGTCAETTADCGLYGCRDGACLVACGADADCSPTTYCNVALSTCVAKHVVGTPCGAARECLSGFCVDDVCCDGTCAGQCEACDLAGAPGTCSPVNGPARGTRTPCPAGAAGDPCGGRICDSSKSTTTCAGYVGPEQECRPGSCADGVETPAAWCDGAGSCSLLPPRRCEPYACAASGCRTDCATDQDCSDPVQFRCDTTAAACTPREAALCAGNIVTAPNGARTDCTPYICVTEANGGRCRTQCDVTTDCVAGYVCDALQGEGVCVAASGDGPGDGGCGCRSSPSGGAPPLSWLALVAVAVWRRAGRREVKGGW